MLLTKLVMLDFAVHVFRKQGLQILTVNLALAGQEPELTNTMHYIMIW